MPILNKPRQTVRINYFKLLVAILTSLYFFYYTYSLSEWHFIDNLNLLIHEAGHPILYLFGDFMGFLGGTLAQLIIPTLFVVYFFRSGQVFSASLTIFWLAQNLLNISVYAGDAIERSLPLIGGEHDWHYLLSRLGLLSRTDMVSGFFYYSGCLLALAAFVFALSLSKERAQI